MDDNQRKIRQNENLKKAVNLVILSHSSEYVNTLLPYLQKLAQVPYMDPNNYKTEEEFMHALKSANMRAGAFAELISFLAQQEAIRDKIREEIDKPTKSHGI